MFRSPIKPFSVGSQTALRQVTKLVIKHDFITNVNLKTLT
jgi:hypothetical protein